jgi:hypothetical protein
MGEICRFKEMGAPEVEAFLTMLVTSATASPLDALLQD